MARFRRQVWMWMAKRRRLLILSGVLLLEVAAIGLYYASVSVRVLFWTVALSMGDYCSDHCLERIVEEGEHALPRLQSVLANTDDVDHAHALMYAIRLIGGPKAFAIFRDVVRSGADEQIRHSALENLSTFTDNPDTIRIVEDVMRNDRSYSVRLGAACALRHVGNLNADTVQYLADLSTASDDAGTRLHALMTLSCAAKNSEFESVFLRGLGDSDLDVQLVAASWLARRGDARGAVKLAQLAQELPGTENDHIASEAKRLLETIAEAKARGR